ncbi:MAG: dTDP-4-amino-4,6-dideoxygalactose transaminase [Betaproteobacteria bacterium]|nr:dTDP-4-amino-4,6-dideoxygalactose transaminase [Betaproteobacteria bacterium]
MKIPFNRPTAVGAELDNIADALARGHLSGDGHYTRRCHQWLERRLGCKHALLTHSCTGALDMAAILCDLVPGDEVIMPSYTFVSTANAFVLRGAMPVFVDIRTDTLNIDERLIEAAITPRTRAIAVVHYAGVACEMDAVMALARRHNLLVVEDAAQALLATYKNRNLGTLGHLGCISFHETKNLISGEGGALLINDERYAERAEIVREKGTNRSRFLRGEVDKYTWVDIGSSYLPSELVAAFLDGQLAHADQVIARRRAIWRRYHAGLTELAASGALELPRAAYLDRVPNGHIFYVLTGTLAARLALAAHLKAQDMLSVSHYVPLHSSPAGRKWGRASGELKVTDDVSDRLLRLPIYFGITDAQVDAVIDAVRGFYKARA